ncbi:MAG: translesion DNA synthesis-associated protein ImuA [Gammaproteobacteria bacterium]|nr:translesion DNA synthesis-associated protein ImuA [Gammaproteobacteria bacterium]
MATETLNELFRQRRVWKGGQAPAGGRCIGTGFTSLDGILPYGGWPPGAVTEITVSDWGIGELSLFLPLMAHYNRNDRYVSWIAPPHTPYPPALAAAGLDLSLCRVLRNPDRDSQVLWCAEKLLQSSACGLVLAWPRTLPGRAVRRLQLAVEKGDASCLLLRREGSARAWDGSPATMRLRLNRVAAGLKLEILKARGTCRYSGIILDI